MNEPLITEIGLAGMTSERWHRLSVSERERLRDNSELNPQLSGREGCRVEVVTTYGEKRRFIVGRSTGWRPIHLEIKTSRSSGGGAAEREYKSVRVIEKVR